MAHTHCAQCEHEACCCDHCVHFLMYRDKEGNILSGDGNCGLHRKEVDAGFVCNEFFCRQRGPLPDPDRGRKQRLEDPDPLEQGEMDRPGGPVDEEWRHEEEGL